MEVHSWRCVPLPAKSVSVLCVCWHRDADSYNGSRYLCPCFGWRVLPVQSGSTPYVLRGASCPQFPLGSYYMLGGLQANFIMLHCNVPSSALYCREEF